MPVPAVVSLGGGDVEHAVIGTVAGRRAHRAVFVPAHLAKHGAVQLGHRVLGHARALMQAVHVLGHDVREVPGVVERDRGEVRLGRFGVLEPRHGHRASLRLLRPYAVPASKVGDRGRCGEPRSRVHDEGPTLTNQLNQYRHVLHHDFGWILALLEALLGLRLASQRALHVGHQRRHHCGMLVQECQSFGGPFAGRGR